MICVVAPPLHIPADPAPRTWCQQDDGGDDQRANDQNDKKGDRYSLPVPLRRVTAHQLLQRDREEERKSMVRNIQKTIVGGNQSIICGEEMRSK